MYADSYSNSMKEAIEETKRRREIQDKYNKEHGIIPKTIIKEIKDVVSNKVETKTKKKMTKRDKAKLISEITDEMTEAAKNMDFERAIELRDILFEMKGI